MTAWTYQVSFDGGKTWKKRAAPPVRRRGGACLTSLSLRRARPEPPRGEIRFSGTSRNAYGLPFLNVRIDAAYQEPAAGFVR